MNQLTQKPLISAGLATVLAAGLWFVLAWRTPTSTFHFAPLVAGGVGPLMVRTSLASRTLRGVLPILGLSAAIVGSTIAGLAAFDRLRGPTFWSHDGALAEALLFASIGLGAGAAVLLIGRAPASGDGAAGKVELAGESVDV